jgi:AcrR family transcriptional regulator
MMARAASLGDQLPASIIDERKRRRIIRAFAGLIHMQGYEATKISDIVKRAGVARKTLYDNFEGKDAVAEALIAKHCPNGPGFDKNDGLGILAIDLAARIEVSDRSGALQETDRVRRILSGLLGSLPTALSAQGCEELVCSLPPGRHGLPRDFVHRNRRHRLLVGTALMTAEHGYSGTTIAHITRAAAVSRRTFYEHFADKWAAAQALISEGSSPELVITAGSGLAILVVEVIAAGVVSEVGAARKVKAAERLLAVFAESLENRQLAEAA